MLDAEAGGISDSDVRRCRGFELGKDFESLASCGLAGPFEGVEGHVVGAVADGVEAELEACHGAVGGHLVEVVLLVAGDAGVGGLVGVGGFEGGGAGAEGAVHEALEHGGVEEGIVEGGRRWRSLRLSTGVSKASHSADAEMEFVVVFEVFEDEEVVPVGEVLDGGDAVGEGVGDGDFEGLAALFARGRRDDFVDEGEGGRFADDAGGFAVGVAVDFAAGGIGGCGGDAGGGEGGGVGDGDVAVGAVEDGGMAGGDGVDVLACGEGFGGPVGVVPAAAVKPCDPGLAVAAKVLMRCCISAREVTWSRSMVSFCWPAEAMWVWASLKPGMAKAPLRSIIFVLGAFSFSTLASVPVAKIFPLATAMAVTWAGVGLGRCWRRWVPVRMLPWM